MGRPCPGLVTKQSKAYTEAMSKTKILIVEDESIIAKDLQTILTDEGYEVPYTATNSKDALKYTEELRPDLILMDVIIQGPVDGVTTAKIINNLYDIPIIFLSAYSDKNTLSRARDVGSYGYLLKPCDERELAIAVDFGLQKARMDRMLKHQNQLLTSAICSIEAGAVVLNKNHQIELINSQAESLTGWKDAELSKKNIHEIFPHFDPLNQKTNELFEGSFTTKEGQTLKLNIKICPLQDSEQQVTGTLLTISWPSVAIARRSAS